jgi:hypothetical protein
VVVLRMATAPSFFIRGFAARVPEPTKPKVRTEGTVFFSFARLWR